MPQKTTQSVRLTEDVIPLHYKIHLTPDLDEFVFEGEEEISLDVSKTTSKIVLHSAELEILSAQASYRKKTLEGKISFDDNSETATITLASPQNASTCLVGAS